MKTFEVELQRTSYITVTVEAENEDDAEAKAYEEIANEHKYSDANWTTESIEEIFS
jgi:ribosomal protein L20A (L18A)